MERTRTLCTIDSFRYACRAGTQRIWSWKESLPHNASHAGWTRDEREAAEQARDGGCIAEAVLTDVPLGAEPIVGCGSGGDRLALDVCCGGTLVRAEGLEPPTPRSGN